jgi:hypothetical protein
MTQRMGDAPIRRVRSAGSPGWCDASGSASRWSPRARARARRWRSTGHCGVLRVRAGVRDGRHAGACTCGSADVAVEGGRELRIRVESPEMCATCGCGGTGVRVTGYRCARPRARPRARPLTTAGRRTGRRSQRKGPRSPPPPAAARSPGQVLAVSLMSSPGSGRRPAGADAPRRRRRAGVTVVEGDQETLLDAERISVTGARVVQVNTGAAATRRDHAGPRDGRSRRRGAR